MALPEEPGWVPGAGLRPKLWGEGWGSGPALVSAVTNIASRQKRRFAEALAAAGGSVFFFGIYKTKIGW